MGAGLAGGADVILIPEIPYDVNTVAQAVRRRQNHGKNFSIVASSEGALSIDDAARLARLRAARDAARAAKDAERKKVAEAALADFAREHEAHSIKLSRELETLTGLESRVTILGYLQRGGTPSAADRILATRLGTACVEAAAAGQYGKMVAVAGEGTKLVELADVVGRLKYVPKDHPWVRAALQTGVSLGNPDFAGLQGRKANQDTANGD